MMCKLETLKKVVTAAVCASAIMYASSSTALAGELGGGVFIPISRSELIVVPRDISEIIIADPDIADVHVIGSRRIAIVGKKIGHTNAKLFDKNNKVIRRFDVVIGYDLPAIRKALHFFLPHERIMVTLVNANIALSGDVSDASVVDKALRIVNEFVTAQPAGISTTSTAATGSGPIQYPSGDSPAILNLLKVTTGQQVMLRVRVGEVQRNTLKNLGISLSSWANNGAIIGATQNKTAIFNNAGTTTTTGITGGVGGVGGLIPSSTDAGFLMGTLTSGGFALSSAIEALETDGLLKILAEPDLVAMSGEKAEFLAGGQFPVQTAAISGGSTIPTISYQSYGVAVQFVPYVLSENRVRIVVQPEVSEIDQSGQFSTVAGQPPALVTRRAKTTVELAPGESFMIAGLMSDRLNSSINQIPGASSIPILGALLRSTAYQRNESELVIAVTPYIVDPMKSSDMRLPSDDFRPASVMEQFFYGSLGSMSGEEYKRAQMPSLEGPIGFITD
jgi:pilus assembly protein CpaC